VLAAGESFPFDFSLTDFSGQAINLTGFQGKVLIVDIWGTWCPPCRAEIPSFVKLQAEYGPQGLQIVGLNYENAENEAAAKELVNKFIQENGMNYPCAMGTPAIQQQVPNFEGYPTTLFIDRTGKVRAKVVGSHEYAFLEAIVKILLAEAAPPPAAPTDMPPAAPTDAPPAAPTDAPPADTGKAPTDTPPAGEGTPPTDAPPSGGGTPPTDAPAEPGK
jgi:thiol-disulfide isomerase/thioredoxin